MGLLRAREERKKGSKEDEFLLIRELALILKKEGIGVNLFASSIRLKKRLVANDLNEEQIETFLESLDTYCFKRQCSNEEFIKLINELSVYSRSYGIPLERLGAHIMKLQRYLTQLKLEIENIRNRKDQALIDHNITIDQLEEYERSKPLICKIDELRDRIKSLS